MARFDARNVISFHIFGACFWRADVRGRFGHCLFNTFCPNRGDVCGKYFCLFAFCRSAYSTARPYAHLSFFLQQFARRATAPIARQHCLRPRCLARAMLRIDLSFDNNGAGYIIISFGAAEKESRSGICDIDSIKGTPRFNLLRLVSTGFTSRVDNCRWLNSGTVLPLIERMFHLELFRFPFPSFLEDVSYVTN